MPTVPVGPGVALTAVLVAGVQAWRLGTLVLLALAALGALLAVRLLRVPATAARTTVAMGVWAHVAELRRRLLWVVSAWLAGTLLAFSLRIEAHGRWLVPVPALYDNLAAQAYRAMASHLVPDGVRLVVLRPLDAFSAEFTIAMAIGLALALPLLLWHAAAFLAPALTPRERSLARWTLLPALGLFALGATVAVTVLAPLLLESLYAYADALGAEAYLLVGELVAFTVTLALVFGFASLTPLVLGALARAGLVTWKGLLGKWRHATVATLVLAAVATDGTIVTLLLVVAPLMALYFLGVVLAAWTGRPRVAD